MDEGAQKFNKMRKRFAVYETRKEIEEFEKIKKIVDYVMSVYHNPIK